jgi:glycosyltransferase involved in cell wall biosynthesis
MITVLLALHRIGPYHHIRLQAAVKELSLHVLETRPYSQEYPWAFHPEAGYPIHRLHGHLDPEQDPPITCLDEQLATLLDLLKPQVVASVGYHEIAYQRLLLATQRRKIPLVIMVDSREQDMPRSHIKEWLKSQLLRAYGSALVSGSESRRYLEKLGLPGAAIFQPWDVIDNRFFFEAANQHPILCGGPISSWPHFLCVSRFVEKKNHAGLIAAYGHYQHQGGHWGLRLIGSGPLQMEILTAIAQLPYPARVQVDPFQQLEGLAVSYAQASAFVLASHSDQWGLVVNEAMAAGLPCLVSNGCGCRADLIDHGRTGWSFDPTNLEQLAGLMFDCERQRSEDRAAMVSAAWQRLEAFTPESFASGLLQAAERALAHPRKSWGAALIAQLISRYS